MSRFERFINLDGATLDRALRVSGACGFAVFFVVRSLAMPGPFAAYLTMAAIFASYLFQAWVYSGRTPRINTLAPRRAFLEAAYASLTALLVILGERAFADPEVVSANTGEILQAVREGAGISRDRALALRSRAVDLLNRNLGPTERKKLAYDYAVLAVALKYAEARPHRYPIVVRGEGTGPRPEIVIGGPDPNGLKPLQDVCPILFYRVGFIATEPGLSVISYSKDFKNKLPECSAVFSNATMFGLNQKLDDIGWVDVVFYNCQLTYSDGHLAMVNVMFVDCVVATTSSTPRWIVDTLSRNGVSITITSDYATDA